jgi:choline dehydrogenase-like flavoprotein
LDGTRNFMDPIDHNVITAPPEKLRTEIAVIGSGPGGSITACLLAEAGREVLLIEEGPFLPLESCPPFSRTEMVQKYRNGGITVAMGQSKVAYVEGRCVGGGSEINSGLYHRTPPDILEDWCRRYQVEALTEADLRPHFEASEMDLCVSYLAGPAPGASLKLREGAEKLGWKSLEVPRWFSYEGPGAPGEPPHGTKQSMSKTFVPRLLAAGGKLLPNTRARRLFRRGDWWRIQTEPAAPGRPERRIDIEAKTVFVACGAVQTPALLRHSGISRNVGNTLHMHPTVKVVAGFSEEVNTPGMGVPVHQVKEFAPRFSFGCSISTLPYLALAMADHPERIPEVDRHWRQMAIYYAMICGGQGSVRNVPFHRDPLVRYRLERHDWANLAEALRKLCQCLFTAGAVTLYPTIVDSAHLTNEADLANLPDVLPPDRANLMAIHLFSSCPMGEDRRHCATDSFGKVHGNDNLYVADGSLLCGSPGVNPQGSIMAIVRRNALKFVGKL